jgi:hypothetical protein
VDSQRIVKKGTDEPLPFNYLVLRISPYDDGDTAKKKPGV